MNKPLERPFKYLKRKQSVIEKDYKAGDSPLEFPFKYLKRKQSVIEKDYKAGDSFDDDIIKNWYRARAFVLDKFENISISPSESKHLHVIVNGDSALMLSVVRQVALTAHFPNYDEQHHKNRTVVSIISDKGETLIDELKQEEHLCNLLEICKYTTSKGTEHKDSYIDIEFEIINTKPTVDKDNEIELTITESEIVSFCNTKLEDELYSIDTSKAQYAGRMYRLGTVIDNLPYLDVHSVERYSMALDVFLYLEMEKELGSIVKEEVWSDRNNQMKVLLGLSNIFCADCFKVRYNSVKPCWKNGKMTEKQAWEKHYLSLSKSEHVRWVVEKLILGFRPMTNEQRLADEGLIKNIEEKNKYRKDIKNNWQCPTHIDLCSYADLRRINPDHMKYDSFLMLAIPNILAKVNE